MALGAVILGFDWLMKQPGNVTIEFPGFVIEPTLAQLAIFFLFLAILSIFCWSLFRFIVSGPEAFSMFLSTRREKQGLDALRTGLVAIGTGDTRLADSMARKAHNLLGPQPLTQLLDAQTALARQDYPEAIAAFETMRAGTETHIIGLNGLFEIAVAKGELKAAYALAEEAFEASPNLKWAGFAVMEGRAAAHEWELAITALQALKKHNHVTKVEALHLKSVLLTAHASELELEEPSKALKLAEDAHSLAPGLVPAAVIAGRIASGRNDVSKAKRIIERCWKKMPHPDLAEIYAYARSADSASDRVKRIKTLINKRAGHAEAPVVLARIAIESGDYQEARKALAMIDDADITKRICALHAQLEDADGNNEGKVREWLARAMKAPVDPAWVADGVIKNEWIAQSPITGKIGVFEWKIPQQPEGANLTISAEKASGILDKLPILDYGLQDEPDLKEGEILEIEAKDDQQAS